MRAGGRLLEVAALRHLTGLPRPTGPLFGSWLMYRLRSKTMALYEVTFDDPDAHGEGERR